MAGCCSPANRSAGGGGWRAFSFAGNLTFIAAGFRDGCFDASVRLHKEFGRRSGADAARARFTRSAVRLSEAGLVQEPRPIPTVQGSRPG